MNKSEKVFKLLTDNQLIALLSPKSAEQCITAYEALSPLGVVLEIAFRTDMALAGIEALMSKHPEALILAGTVMTEKQAAKAIEAGVAGVVSPDYMTSVVEYCVKNDILCAPGGLGDVGKQLAQKAALYNCEFDELKQKYPYQWIYKLYPCTTKTIRFIELADVWKKPFKGLNIIYTGGVSLSNLEEIVQYDPDGIFCGSALTKSIDKPEEMVAEAEKWLSILRKK